MYLDNPRIFAILKLFYQSTLDATKCRRTVFIPLSISVTHLADHFFCTPVLLVNSQAQVSNIINRFEQFSVPEFHVESAILGHEKPLLLFPSPFPTVVAARWTGRISWISSACSSSTPPSVSTRNKLRVMPSG
jgi:hypothetical protein